MAYQDAYKEQIRAQAEVLAAREAAAEPDAGAGVIESGAGNTSPADGRRGMPRPLGEVLLVEHPAVITISNRAGAGANLLASTAVLASKGVGVASTDRGGDITYHGPGQIVVYPVLDLNALNLGLHEYMRMLEEAVISTCSAFGVVTMRDPSATGVWTVRDGLPAAKIAAMGVRVRRWISMHGLALNVRTNLDHFGLIVPCGLVGREVTSLERELGPACPSFEEAQARLVAELTALIRERERVAAEARAKASA